MFSFNKQCIGSMAKKIKNERLIASYQSLMMVTKKTGFSKNVGS